MKVSSTKLKTTPDIFPACPLLSPTWLFPQLSFTITLCLTTQFYCMTLCPFYQRSLSVSLRKSTLDQHPKTHGSKYKRDHGITFFFFSPTLNSKGRQRFRVYYFCRSTEGCNILLQSQSPLGQYLLLVSKPFSAHDPRKFDVLTLIIFLRVCIRLGM